MACVSKCGRTLLFTYATLAQSASHVLVCWAVLRGFFTGQLDRVPARLGFASRLHLRGASDVDTYDNGFGPDLELGLKLATKTGTAIDIQEREHSLERVPNVLWIHAASVGETKTALTLISLLRASTLATVLNDDNVDYLLTYSSDGVPAALAVEAHEAGVFLVPAPIDVPWCVQQFLSQWKPFALILIESELWPNYLRGCNNAGLAVLLVNGRISPRSARRWNFALARPMFASMISMFRLVLCQDRRTQTSLQQLGAQNPKYLGNLKCAAYGGKHGKMAPFGQRVESGIAGPVEGANCVSDSVSESLSQASLELSSQFNRFDKMTQRTANAKQLQSMECVTRVEQRRPCWVGLSTHEREELVLYRAHVLLCQRLEMSRGVSDIDSSDQSHSHKPLLILVPRHSNRGQTIQWMLEHQGANVALRSVSRPFDALSTKEKLHFHENSNEDEDKERIASASTSAPMVQNPLCASTDVYVMDTMGEVSLTCHVADAVFVGGSLFNGGGGHNVLEPCSMGVPVVTGPYTHSFDGIIDELRVPSTSNTHTHTLDRREEDVCVIQRAGTAETIANVIEPLLNDAAIHAEWKSATQRAMQRFLDQDIGGAVVAAVINALFSSP